MSNNNLIRSDRNDLNDKSFPSQLSLYPKLYQKACVLAAARNQSETSSGDLIPQITMTMENLTKLVFGQDQVNKAKLVLYGGGALELIVGLVERSQIILNATQDTNINEDQRKLLMAAIKAIKICVLRNPPGRARARISGASETLLNIIKLTLSCIHKDAVLMDEALTAYAAVCLGDDLNALQASFLLRKYMKEIKDKYPAETHQSIDQKLLYLSTLFDTLEKEQSNLLQYLKKKQINPQSFFDQIINCEKDIRIGYSHAQDKKHSSAIKHFNHALKILEDYMSETQLLNDFTFEIRRQRVTSEFEVGDFESVARDTSILLEGFNDISIESSKDASTFVAKEEQTLNGRVDVMKLRAKALLKLNRSLEAKEMLGKLKLLVPQDSDVSDLLVQLS